MNTTLFTYPSFLLEIHTQPNQRKDKIKYSNAYSSELDPDDYERNIS